MRSFSGVFVGLLLTCVGQLAAQTADPFGPEGDGPGRVVPIPADHKPELPAKKNQAKNQVAAPASSITSPFVVAGPTSAAQARIDNALSHETTFDYLDQPLKDVIEDISFNHGIPIVIDTKALEDFGIDTGTPITKALKGISLRAALRLTLRELECTFVIRDEVLQITTLEVADVTLSTRCYHVAEFLPPDHDGQVLVDLIKTSVFPDTWDGIGSITYVVHLESLVISHHDEALHQIEELLATTKKLASLQPTTNAMQPELLGSQY